MSTFSTQNIITNSLTFPTGITAGYVLAMNSNGSTSWVSHNSGGGSTPSTLAVSILGSFSFVEGTYITFSATASTSIVGTEWISSNGYKIAYDNGVYIPFSAGTYSLTALSRDVNGLVGTTTSQVVVRQTPTYSIYQTNTAIDVFNSSTNNMNIGSGVNALTVTYPSMYATTLNTQYPTKGASLTGLVEMVYDGSFIYACNDASFCQVVKYDTNFNVIWATGFTATNVTSIQPGELISVDNTYVYVTDINTSARPIRKFLKSDGSVVSTITLSSGFNSGSLYQMLTSNAGEIYMMGSVAPQIRKFSATGSAVWTITTTNAKTAALDEATQTYTPFQSTAALLKSYSMTQSALTTTTTYNNVAASSTLTLSAITYGFNGNLYYSGGSQGLTLYKFQIGVTNSIWNVSIGNNSINYPRMAAKDGSVYITRGSTGILKINDTTGLVTATLSCYQSIRDIFII